MKPSPLLFGSPPSGNARIVRGLSRIVLEPPDLSSSISETIQKVLYFVGQELNRQPPLCELREIYPLPCDFYL